MYEAEDAEMYDLVHAGRGKDYRAEATQVCEAVRERCPDANSLLDVACGTGIHLGLFADMFREVEGIDLSVDMLALAQRRLTGVRLNLGDMRSFDLGRTFDVVTCMFASIGHMETITDLTLALSCFARHVPAPGGIVVVEPWWFPETFTPHHVAADIVTAGHRTVARVSHSTRDERASRMAVQYLVADPENGIRHLSEDTRITLFTRAEYEQAFHDAGMTPAYLPGVISGRGLFVGVRKGSR